VKKPFIWITLLIAILIIGCGGGGGGDDTTGTTATTSTTSTTSTTDGSTTGIQTGVYGVLRDSAGQGVGGAVIKFYDASGGFISQTTSRAAGGFEKELPTSARQFTIDISGIPNSTNYFNQVSYNQEEYLSNDAGCLAPLPAFAQGQAKQLLTDVVITPRWLGPPPPPTGCL
jgi:hypothetical protein